MTVRGAWSVMHISEMLIKCMYDIVFYVTLRFTARFVRQFVPTSIT